MEKAEPQCDIEASARKLEAAVEESGHSEPVLTCACGGVGGLGVMHSPGACVGPMTTVYSDAFRCEEVAAAEKRGGGIQLSEIDMGPEVTLPFQRSSYPRLLACTCGSANPANHPCPTHPNGAPKPTWSDDVERLAQKISAEDRAQEARDALRVRGEAMVEPNVRLYAVYVDAGQESLPRLVAEMSYEDWKAGEEFRRLPVLSWGSAWMKS